MEMALTSPGTQSTHTSSIHVCSLGHAYDIAYEHVRESSYLKEQVQRTSS